MSKPRYLADFEIEEVQEKSGGRFQIKGVVGQKSKKKKKKSGKDSPAVPEEKAPTIFAEKLAPEGNGEADKTNSDNKTEPDKKEIDKKEAKANQKKAEAEQKEKALAPLLTHARRT